VVVGLFAASPALADGPVSTRTLHLTQPVSIPIRADFRLRVAVPASEPNWRMIGPDPLARRSASGALIDFFPFDDRFHLSAGGRLLSRSFARWTDPASLQLLPAMRTGSARAGRRFSPAMLMGYSETRPNGLALGLDAGVLVGQTDPSPDFRIRGGDRPRAPRGVNGLARMTVRYPF
jgi:hypothetical protein